MEVREPSAKYIAAQSTRHTELGLLPLDWEVTKLHAIATVTSGKRLPFGRSLTTHETAHPYIRVSDMCDGTVSAGAIQYVPDDVFPQIKRYCISRDDLYISVAGTLGLVGSVPDEFDGANLTENANRISGIQGSKGYLYQVLASPVVQSVIESERTVGAQPKLALVRIRNFSVPLPPTVKEQHAIAQALTDADALIDSLEQLLTKKRQIKQGAMQELLTGKRRLPGFAGQWRPTRLSELGQCVRGVAYNPDVDLAPHDTAKTVRLLRSNNVKNGHVVLGDVQFVDQCRVKDSQSFQQGDVLICMANGSKDLVGKAGRFQWNDGHRYTFGAFMAAYRIGPELVDGSFLAHHFQTHSYREHIALLLAGSSINNLTPDGLLSFRLSLPSDGEEQQAIAQVLSDIDTDIAAIEARLAKARDIKQAMMQVLLTGRIRLVQPEA